jgi:SusD family.
MMKTINKLSIAFIASIVLLFGCSKDFLDTNPQGSIPPDQFYLTDADATSAVAAAYQMNQALYASPWTSMWMLKELPSGDILCGGGSRGDQSNYEEIAEFRYGSNNNVITQVYSMAYYIILRTNLVIDNVKGDNAYRKYVIAEAKTLRAIMYFDLVTLWGPVPLVLHKLNDGEFQQPNSTVAALWAQIEADLNAAIPDLPVKSGLKAIGSDVSRVSKGTAESMLGKALLYQKKYAAAAAALQSVITSGEYDLVADYSQILRKANEFGKESVFEISYSNAQNNTWGTPNIWADPGRTTQDNVHWQLCGPRGDDWFSSGNSGLNPGWGFASPTKDLYDIYVAANDTIRRKASIMDEATLISLGGKIRSNSNGSYPYGSQGFVRLKYGTWADETSVGYTPERNFGTNFRLIRYADVLLMAAEALILQPTPDEATAKTYINLVRQRAKCSDITSSGDQLLADLKLERQLELSFEGVRFQDLIRWGDANTALANVGKVYYLGTFTGGVEDAVSTGGSFTAPKNLLFPFPANEILVNSKIIQNPGGY